MNKISKPPFDSSLNENSTVANFSLERAQFSLTTAELENVIEYLGRLRSCMAPIVPLDPGTTPPPFRCLLSSGHSYVYPKSDTEMGVLLVRTTQFGWVSLSLSEPDRITLGEMLLHGIKVLSSDGSSKH